MITSIMTSQSVSFDFNKLIKYYINAIYKALPLREEGKDWKKYVDGLVLELEGATERYKEFRDVKIFRIIIKLNSLKFLTSTEDFQEYRRIIFDCLDLLGKVGEIND